MKDRKAHRPCHPRGSVRLPLPLLFYSRIPRLGIRSPCSGDVRLLAWLLVAACPPRSGTTAGYSKLRRKFDQTAVRCLDFCVVGASPATTVCASREAKSACKLASWRGSELEQKTSNNGWRSKAIRATENILERFRGQRPASLWRVARVPHRPPVHQRPVRAQISGSCYTRDLDPSGKRTAQATKRS